MTANALMELADRLSRQANKTVESPAPHLTGDMKFYVYELELRELLTEAATQLRTAASGVPVAEVIEVAMYPDDYSTVKWLENPPEAGTKLYLHPGAEARDAVTLADINAAFNNEIDRVSTLEFNSNEICRAFYRNLLKRINPDWDPAMQEAALRARDD